MKAAQIFELYLYSDYGSLMLSLIHLKNNSRDQIIL